MTKLKKKEIIVGNITESERSRLEALGYLVRVQISVPDHTSFSYIKALRDERKAQDDAKKAEALANFVPVTKIVYKEKEPEICTRDHVKHDNEPEKK